MTTLTADVRTAETMDRLVVTPRSPADLPLLGRALRQGITGVRLSRVAEGFAVPADRVAALLAMEGPPTLRWSEEAQRFAANRQRAEEVHELLREEVRRTVRGGRPYAERLLNDVQSLHALDDHQWVNVAAMTLPDSYGLCLFDEQGAGKTVTLIFAFDVLAGRDMADFALIVAPKSMVAEWPRDFRRFRGDLYRIVVVTGDRREKARAMASGADVIVTNFESVVSMEEEFKALLRCYGDRAILVVDESFFIKNLNAKRTQVLRRLREWSGRAFVLCGTPAPNAPHDLVQQFSIVDFGHTFSGVDIPKDRRAARPVVQRAIERRGLYVRHLKRVVLPQLPLKKFHRVLVPLERQQEKLYDLALRNLIVDLRGTDEDGFRRNLGSFLARRNALLQICSNPRSLVRGYTELPGKLRALDSLLDEVIGRRSEKVVLWSFYTASLDAIFARYDRFNPVRYDGTVADVGTRREAVRRFQEDDSTMLFVANPAAAGAGLTLHRARIAIYESMSNQAAHYLQSLDRIHRRGQRRDVEYLVLLCERTLEVQEYERLIVKERSAQDLLGDEAVDTPTRESMLAETLEALSFLNPEEGGDPKTGDQR